jgi:ABC-2 type transport system permease protein
MTTTAVPVPARKSPLDGIRVTFPNVVRSEWVRFRSLRSSWVTLAVTVVLLVGLAALFSWARAAHWPPRDQAEAASFDPTQQAIAGGTFLGQLAIGVLGVLLVTGEYATGMIRATMTAVPQRAPVLVARAFVFALFMLVVLVPSVVVAFLVGQVLLASKGIDTTLGAPNVLRMVAGAGLYLVGIGLLGMGLGWLLRHTAGAISTLFGTLFILPLIVHFLPAPWPVNLTKWLPGGVGDTAGLAIWTPHPGAHSFGPWAGFGVLMLWVVAMFVIGAIILRRRDV